MSGRGLYALALAAAAGVAALIARQFTASGGVHNPVTGTGEGYDVEDDVELTPAIIANADALVAHGAPPFLITSGWRSPRRQAQAMFYLIEQGKDLANFLALYHDDDTATAVFEAYPDLDAATAILEANPISSHMREDSGTFDVRRVDDDFAAALLLAGEDAGIRVLDELTGASTSQGSDTAGSENNVIHVGA